MQTKVSQETPNSPGPWRSARRAWAARAAVGLSRCCGRRVREAFGILTYHRIAEPITNTAPPTWNVTPDHFRRQLTSLLDRGYQAWPLGRVLDYHRCQRQIPRNVFVVTFDDGFENVFQNAWPILRELKIPATIFLATAYLDSSRPFPFDDWADAGGENVPPESWRPLTTAQCQEMLASGLIELGTHTHSHDDFRGRPAALRHDLQTSLSVLRERFDVTNATFAFPFGIYDEELCTAAKEAGVLCSLTTQSNLVRPDCDPFTWGRFSANDNESGSMLAAKLDGWYSLARGVWLGMKRPFRAARPCTTPQMS